MKKSLSIFTAMYGWLLRFFPHDFREEFYEEMLLDFTNIVEAASKRGAVSLFGVLLRELRDFPINLLRAYLVEEYMFNIFQPESMKRILRITLVFGLGFAINKFAGILMFIDQTHLVSILRFAHSIGWQGTYKDVEPLISIFSSFTLGPLLAGIFLLLVFPELRPIKRYLFTSMLIFAIPSMPAIFLKYSKDVFANTLIALSYYFLIGFGFGILASLITQDRKKVPWFLLVGVLGYFLVSLGSALLIMRLQIPFLNHASFWSGILFIAAEDILTGSIVGILLGVVSVWSRQKATLA